VKGTISLTRRLRLMAEMLPILPLGDQYMNLVWRRKLAGHCTELELTIESWVQYFVGEVLSSLDMANGESRVGHLDTYTLNDSASIPKLASSVTVVWTSVVARCNSP
jgi:hypothetical protein